MIQVNPTPNAEAQPELNSQYDVIVIGGGPAGSTVAALTAEQGHDVLVLERAPFPRFHIGESLIPETYWTLERLGLLDRLKQSAFPKKFSVQFVSDGTKVSAPFYFDDHNPHESSQTWQIVRSDFDQMMLDNAKDKGATCHTSARVLDVIFDDAPLCPETGEPKGRATSVKVQLVNSAGEKETREITAKIIVDATGQSAFLATRLGLKKPDERLQKGTVWSYFKEAVRDEGRDEGATIIMQTEGKQSWFWYIPLPDDVVSVGCTGSMQYMFGNDRGTPEEIFQRELSRCPAMQDRLAPSERVADYLTTRDFSYRSQKAAGPGWMLIGDAFGFIDPVYSSGVFLALKSGELAADAIHDALQANNFSTEELSVWQPKYIEGLEMFRKLVYAFYTPGFSFGMFLKEHPQYRSNLVDLLVGDVFREGVGEIFDAMGEILPPSDRQPVITTT